MALPDEIKLRIVNNLDVDTFPALFNLRCVHSWFRSTISSSDLHDQLLAAEYRHGLITRKELACYMCLKVMPISKFADSCRRTPRGLGGKQAYKRFCIECGANKGRYRPGNLITFDKEPAMICPTCHKFCREEEKVGFISCKEHGGKWELPKKQRLGQVRQRLLAQVQARRQAPNPICGNGGFGQGFMPDDDISWDDFDSDGGRYFFE